MENSKQQNWNLSSIQDSNFGKEVGIQREYSSTLR